jgi:hypothetical protein
MTIKSSVPVAAAFTVALIALLVAAWFVYRPGITGVFLLDDFSNLNALGTWGPVTHWDAFWRYLTSGTADPAGRPLSLLSFLLDAQSWPASATPFKVTNILLHLLNGVLLCWAMLKLARRRGIEEPRAAMATWIGAGIWLLHPLFVSTTLYVVQREAMLPATFTFIGIICWCAGRDAFDADRTGRAIALMASGAWLCTLLAMLCKANGILLPLLLAVTEATVLRTREPASGRNPRTRRITCCVLLGLPIAAVLAYLIHLLPAVIHTAPAVRGWTVGQRLLTEPRVLIDYLRLLWIPHTVTFGIFNDQIRASRSMLDPWTTLPSIVAVAGLIVGGWLVRRRHPVVAFAILFFFAGQLLESSFLPLELAFEHRNYLPAAFMFLPLGIWLSAPEPRPQLRRLAAAALLCTLAVITWMRAGVWGNVQMQAALWGRINPSSPQAQSFSASVEAAWGNPHAAIVRLREASLRMPDQPQVALTLVGMECRTGTVSSQSWDQAMYALRRASAGWNNIANWFVTTSQDVASDRCEGLTIAQLELGLAAVRSNPNFERWHPYERAFTRADAVVHLAGSQPQPALADFNSLLASDPTPGAALEQAKALAAFGYPKLALRHLDYYAALPPRAGLGIGMPRIHTWVLHEQDWWVRQLTAFRTQFGAEAASSSAAHADNSRSCCTFSTKSQL